jgi:hypothetical protein
MELDKLYVPEQNQLADVVFLVGGFDETANWALISSKPLLPITAINSKYKCSRVDNSNTLGRIIPKIHERIERSAFAIVELN